MSKTLLHIEVRSFLHGLIHDSLLLSSAALNSASIFKSFTTAPIAHARKSTQSSPTVLETSTINSQGSEELEMRNL